MKFLTTAFFAAAIALAAASSANAMSKKSGHKGQFATSAEVSVPTSRAAQESLTW